VGATALTALMGMVDEDADDVWRCRWCWRRFYIGSGGVALSPQEALSHSTVAFDGVGR